jgi:hypothetical protein
MNVDEVLLRGLAQDINDQEWGLWTPNDVYAEDARGIVLEDLPETPSEVIALSPYAESTTGDTYRRDVETSVWFIQIRVRTESAKVGRDLQSQMRDRYHRRRITLEGPEGEMLTVTGRQLSRGPLGPDGNGRRLYTQNFTFTGRRARTE